MPVAVIQTGGKQYVARPGEQLVIERLSAEPATTVDFPDLLHGKTVTARVVAHLRGDKIHVRKYKAKVRYLRRIGHRQDLTRIAIEQIT